MKIIKIDLNNIVKTDIREIAEAIKNGQVVAMPFDTSYGLAVDATNPEAVERLYRVKERDRGKPISVVVRDFAMLEEMAVIASENVKELALKYLPGKVTFVFEARENAAIDQNLLGGKKQLGIRIPNFKLINDVAWEIGVPFTATSANIAGESACMSAGEVLMQFEGKEYTPDLLVDSGKLPNSESSTVADLSVFPPLILRQGAVIIKEAE